MTFNSQGVATTQIQDLVTNVFTTIGSAQQSCNFSPCSNGGIASIEAAFPLAGFNAPNGHGLGRVAVAADEKFLYAAYDGTAWGQAIDRGKPDWSEVRDLLLASYQLVAPKRLAAQVAEA